MPIDQGDGRAWGCALLGGLVGTALIQHHHDEAKKSQAEKENRGHLTYSPVLASAHLQPCGCLQRPMSAVPLRRSTSPGSC